MKKQWLGYAALILLAISMAACEEAGTVKKPDAAAIEKAAEEAAKEVKETVKIPSSKLPPPREQLADTPDVKNARFEITDQSITSMREDGVPDSVTSALEALKGQVFFNAADFNEAVADAIGDSAFASHRAAIMRFSTHVKLAVEPPFPGTDISLMAAQPMGTIGTVFFEFDKSDIKPAFMAEIEAHAKALLENSSMKIKIEGHCDERGTTEYNLALGERRANAVKDALIANGVSAGEKTD